MAPNDGGYSWWSERHCALESSEKIGEASIPKVPDVEDIQAPPAGWLPKIYHALQNSEEIGVATIPKIPNSLRSPARDFTPVQWWFGLHNREALHTGGSESLKIRAASAFGLKGPSEWDEFCSDVVDNPVELLKTYGLRSVDDVMNHISGRELKCLVTLDVLFLVLFMDWISQRFFTDSPALRSFFKSSQLQFQALKDYDLFLIENQIPMALLRNVIKSCYRRISNHEVTRDQEEEMLDTMLKATVRWLFPLRTELHINEEVFYKNYPKGKLGQCPTILDCLHQVICGPDAVLEEETGDRRSIAIESATTLEAAGIKIKAHQGTLDKTSFQNGVLHLPFLSMEERTVPLFRNLALFELFRTKGSTLRDYLQLMSNLIDTPADVRFLEKCEVIRNLVNTNACEHWHALDKGLLFSTPSPTFYNLKADIDKHCRSKLKVFRAEFIRLFCSKPWLVLSAITVILVTLATGINTYAAVIGSNRMRPHFRH